MYSKLGNVFDMRGDSYVGKTSNGDFVITYVSETKLSFSGLPITTLTVADIVGVAAYDSDGVLIQMYWPTVNDMIITGTELEIIGAKLNLGSFFAIYTNIPRTKIALVEGDIEIGAVEIKDATSGNRAVVDGDGNLQVNVSNIFNEIQWDTITPTFDTLTDTYVFEYNSSVTATVVLTYTDSTKDVLSLVTKF